MTKVIIHSDSSLDSFYERALEYLLAKYHGHSSNQAEPENSEVGEMAYYEAMARQAADDAEIPSDIPIGKMVI